MQFIIYQNDLRKYFSYKGKVIVFDDEQEAYSFANVFYQEYALPAAMQSIFSGSDLINRVLPASNSWVVQELPKDMSCETIIFKDLINNRRQ